MIDIYFLFACLIAGVLVQAFTWLWYAPFLAGGQWRAALKRKEDAKIPARMHLYSFILWTIAAGCFGYFTDMVLGLSVYIDYLILAALMAGAFILPSKVMHVLYAGQSKRLIVIDVAHAFISFMIISAVFFLI